MSKKLLIELDLTALDQKVAFEFDLRGTNWTISTEKKNESLAVYLKANENYLGKLSWNVRATIALNRFRIHLHTIIM